MNLKSKLIFIKKQDKNKSTIALFVLLSLVIFVVFSFSKTLNNYDKNYTNYDYYYHPVGLLSHDKFPDMRESMDKLKKVKYVKDVFSTAEREYIVNVNKLGDKEMNGLVQLRGKTLEDLKEISNGNYVDKHSIICHKNYYPDTDGEINMWVSKSKFISMENYKNKIMQIHYINPVTRVKYEDKLNIVEIIDNDKILVDESVCYASRELLWEYYQNQMKESNENIYWEDLLAEYDMDHYDEINAEFSKLGFWASKGNAYNTLEYTVPDTVNRFKSNLLIVSIIVIGIFILVFNKNKIKDRVKTYGILKTVGTPDKEFNDLLDIESIYVVIKSFILSILASLIVCLIVYIIRYFYPFFLMKVYIMFDWICLIIYYLFVLILLCLSNFLYFKKIKNKSIVENISDEINH